MPETLITTIAVGTVLRVILIAAVAIALLRASRHFAPRFSSLLVRARADDSAALPEQELAKRRHTIAGVLERTLAAVVLTLAAFTVLSEVGVDITPVLAGIGVVGIAVGFGAQSLVRDVIGGVLILIEDQYRRGDVVRLAGVAGLVEDVNLRRTVLRDLDGIVYSVPNGEVSVSANFTRGYARVNLDVVVGYGEDLDRVHDVLDRVGAELAADPEWKDRIMEPPAVLRVDALGDSGVALKVLGTTAPIEQWAVAGELRRRIKAAFDREGIEIPFPHRTVVIRREDRAAS
ncbi:MAG TPA: mechanosensitive ion channel family protein [Candidatus Limnocylindrales bacterium]|nr:mechanosensitive ion channel family protein [Candidatus Limnocylindrales bacterium]